MTFAPSGKSIINNSNFCVYIKICKKKTTNKQIYTHTNANNIKTRARMMTIRNEQNDGGRGEREHPYANDIVAQNKQTLQSGEFCNRLENNGICTQHKQFFANDFLCISFSLFRCIHALRHTMCACLCRRLDGKLHANGTWQMNLTSTFVRIFGGGWVVQSHRPTSNIFIISLYWVRKKTHESICKP